MGADSWQQRVKNQTPIAASAKPVPAAGSAHGPCRITPKAPWHLRLRCPRHRGRNFLRFVAGGPLPTPTTAGRSCHTLYESKEGGAYQVKDPEKLIRIAKEWGVETEGKDIYDLAHEVAEMALLEYGKPFGTQRFLKRAPSTPRSCGMTPVSNPAPSTGKSPPPCT